MSRPWAIASRFPCTRLPTITEAGPTEVSVTDPDELPIVGGWGGGGRAPICFVCCFGEPPTPYRDRVQLMDMMLVRDEAIISDGGLVF